MNNSNTLVIDAFWADDKPFPTEIKADSDVGKVLYSEYHGTAKHLGWMDLVQLRYLVKRHCVKHLVLKNLNLLGKVAQVHGGVEVCTSYTNTHTFHLIHEMSNEEKILNHHTLFYHMAVFGGWEQSPDATELHCRAIRYMKYLLAQTKVADITFATDKVSVTIDKNGIHTTALKAST